MNDTLLHSKFAELPTELKSEVIDFVDFLYEKSKKQAAVKQNRIPGKAKGLIEIKDNFDEPIDAFNDYMK